MSDAPAMQFSREEILVLRFAAHRQLARWAKNPRLSTHQRAQRKALKRVVGVLQGQALADGYELRALSDGGDR